MSKESSFVVYFAFSVICYELRDDTVRTEVERYLEEKDILHVE